MSDKETLEAAINKAIDGGWNPGNEPEDLASMSINRQGGWTVNDIIFDKDFAKALWGNKKTESWNDYEVVVPYTGWQYHIQQMVIAENPIEYLKENM